MSGPAATAASARYYESIARLYGFADSAMRGNHNVVRAKPISVCGPGEADKFCATRSPDLPPKPPKLAYRDAVRAQQAAELLSQLRDLVASVSVRLKVDRPKSPACDALADAEAILDSREPTIKVGDRLETMRTLITILARYA